MDWFRRHLLKSSDAKIPNLQSQSKSKETDEDEQQIYGITEELINHVKSFTLDTFKNYPLQDEDESSTYDLEAQSTSTYVENDLSQWQEKHAILILSRVKEISQLRYLLCPGRMKEKQFWKTYFKLTRNYLVEYELRAVQREKLRRMAMEDEKSTDNTPYEVEMSEAKHENFVKPPLPS